MVRVHNSQIRNEHDGSSICCSNKFQLLFHFSVLLMNANQKVAPPSKHHCCEAIRLVTVDCGGTIRRCIINKENKTFLLLVVVYINSTCYHLFLCSVKVNCKIDKLGVYAIIFHTIFSYQAMDSSWHITYTITDKQLQQF
ncbi:hypothetical protein Gotur_026350 [Gossypium turneri]